MRIIRVGIGNAEEAYIEGPFSDGINIIFSDENNKGKTIIIQSILYALGNKPIFPDSFNYVQYYYYLQFEQCGQEYELLRCGDTYVIKTASGLKLCEGMSDLKRFWSENIFTLPVIPVNGTKTIVDMELFCQLFFVGQDGKNTSTIFNQGYYHKADFTNLLLSFAEDFFVGISEAEQKKLRIELQELERQRKEQVNLSDFYKSGAIATEYLSHIKDRDAFQRRMQEMDAITDSISDIRKKRNRYATKKSLWNSTLKELRSLNSDIHVGELRCMDCDSTHITYKGKGKATYSFDVSTPAMRRQIIESILDKIKDISEEIQRCDFEIEQCQNKLNSLMQDDEVTLENIVAFKSGFKSVQEIEEEILRIDELITEKKEKLETGVAASDEAKKKRADLLSAIIEKMNYYRLLIDPESQAAYEDLFTKRGSVVSGSEETVFYTSKLLAIQNLLGHSFPIIIDSFRAEDLSTDKEARVIDLLKECGVQSILTTTLKKEENGKYSSINGVHTLDYSSHQSCKILQNIYCDEFSDLVASFGMKIIE